MHMSYSLNLLQGWLYRGLYDLGFRVKNSLQGDSIWEYYREY